MSIMKRIFYIVLAALALVACEEATWLNESEHPMPDGVGAKPEFVFDGEPTISVSKHGGDYTASIKANQPWLVESTVGWVTVTSDRVGKGDGSAETVAFTVQKNPSLEPREGKIRMWITNEDEAFIVIKQEPLLLEDLGNDYYVKPNATGSGASWADPISLSAALEAAVDADKIHVAAGTYIPEAVLPGGEAGGDETFFVKANIQLIGGYPANAKDGDTPDHKANKTILSGNDACNHVMVIGAPKSDMFTATVKGFTLTKGCSAISSAPTVNVNGIGLYKSYGVGLAIAGGRAIVEDCDIIENTATKYNAGVFINGAEVTLRRCLISDNKVSMGSGNGVAFWNGPKAVTRMYDCVISKHTSTGVGAVYNYEITAGNGTPSLYMMNCEVTGISNGSYGALYNRDGNCVLVNCTVHGNSAKTGAGVFCYGANGIMTMISCTVTGNTGTVGAGGLASGSNAKVYVYNSVIAGNSANDMGNADATGYTTFEKSSTSASFGAYNNGVYPVLSGADGGMTVAELQAIDTKNSVFSLVPEDVEVDAKGTKRTGTVMGAYIGK